MSHPAPSVGHSVPFNIDLADRLTGAGIDLAGSLYAVPDADRVAAAHLLSRRGHWIHADVFADASSGVSPALINHLADQGLGHIDVHLISDDAMTVLDLVCRPGIARVTFPYEGTSDVEAIATQVRAAGAEPWLAIAPGTRVDDCRGAVTHVDGLLVMLIEPGTKQAADLTNLVKVETLHTKRPVGVDGGVTEANIDDILAAGTSYLVVGRRLFMTPTTKPKGGHR